MRARESSAGKRTMCPKCGDPVGIPLQSVVEPVAPPTAVFTKAPAVASQETIQPPVGQGAPSQTSNKPKNTRDAQQDSQDAEASSNSELESPQNQEPSVAPERPAPRPRQPQPTGPVPYWEADGPVVPVRRIKRRDEQRKKRRAAQPSTSELINSSGEVGIQVRRKARWYRLIGRSRTSPAFELEYKLGNIPIVIGHMLLHTICMCILIEQLPEAMQKSSFADWSPVFVTGVVWFAVGTFTISLISQVLAHAAKGVVDEINKDPVIALRLLGRWIVIAIAGPALLLSSAIWFWIICGEITLLDWIVLGELIIATFAYFLVSGTTTLAIERLKGVLPTSVLGTIAAMPLTVLWSTLVFLVSGVGSTWLIKTAAEDIHASGDVGYFLVALAAITMGLVGLGLAHWLGGAFFKHRMDTMVDQVSKTIVPKDMSEFAEIAKQTGRSVGATNSVPR